MFHKAHGRSAEHEEQLARVFMSIDKRLQARRDARIALGEVGILVNNQNDSLCFGVFEDGFECNLDRGERCSCGAVAKYHAAEQREVFACNGLLSGKEDHMGFALCKDAKQAGFTHATPSIDYGKLKGTFLIGGFQGFKLFPTSNKHDAPRSYMYY